MEDLPEIRRSSAGLRAGDYGANAVRALIRGIPYFGSSLEQFIWGPAGELRWRRMEQTLAEVAQAVRRAGSDRNMHTEKFVYMLEATLPLIGRATNDDKRSRLRDLLVNSAQLGENDRRWEEADLARELVAEIDGPGLAILAALGRTPEAFVPRRGGLPVPGIHLVSQPAPQLIRQPVEWTSENWDALELSGEPLGYDWAPLEEWVRRLRDKRLILFHKHDSRGAFGGVHLTSLGEMLVRLGFAGAGDARLDTQPTSNCTADNVAWWALVGAGVGRFPS